MRSSETTQFEYARKCTLNAIWEYHNALGIREDNDGFSIALASTFVKLKSSGVLVSEERWFAATTKQRTTFYRLNRIGRKNYLTNLLQKLNALDINITVHAFEDTLCDFKSHVERQQKGMFHLNLSKQEEIGRQLLLAFLPQRGYREVPTGSGKMDIACFEESSVKYAVETKIWRSYKYYLDGFGQLIEYLKTEQLERGYYVVFAEKLRQSGAATNIPSQDCFWESKEGKKIFVVLVDISLIPPSRKEIIKRKTMGVKIENKQGRGQGS